ncbi:DHA2 family efflux MFS transporter permease subunit [Sphingomonas sp. AP4-R1]|uniref:DHA2 family efflux MFS transporter permease subunit n=1 Tax=Sphingomonas sp. AP4-R1 TaxID=2735134 RepID=UPI0014933F64|nr:DHA2 family efflux MFS transporter permease subunit [Sphingomonas sp. AP4-R1]QJU56695.1 DHA2 family efflux MFS transporter permease subunit [Sphingomonas sp. AP4-R1]
MASAAATAPQARPAVNPWLVGVILALSNFMVVLDISIANVSVPHIAGSLAISPDQGTWVITSYSVAEAICVPLTGWLVARFGTVRTYLVAMTGFGIFSVLCGLSTTLGMLVACRIGQGICGGPIMPLTQTLLMAVFPPEKRGQGMGLWAMTTVVAPIAGPLLGGPISDNWSWHWIFFINIPIAIICVGGSFINLKSFETPTRAAPIDKGGMILLVIWVGALQIMLDIGRDHDWFSSDLIKVLAVVAAIGFVAFVIWEMTEEQPAVNLRVFRHRGFTMSVISLSLTYAIFFSAIVVTPQWLQGAMGYTATWSGFVVAWQGLFAVIMSPIVGKLVAKTDPRRIYTIGVLWMGVTMLIRSHWSTDVDYFHLMLPHLLLGIGMPMFFVPVTMIALAAVDPHEVPGAAGLQNFARTLSGAFGTSIATTLWQNGAEAQRSELTNILQPGLYQDQLAQAGFVGERARGLLEQLVMSQGFALSLVHIFQGAAVLLFISSTLVWFAPRPRAAPPPGSAH